MQTKSRDKSLLNRLLRYLFLLLLVLGTEANAQQEMTPWWKNRPLRIYHPNMRELEAMDLDVKQFIADCKALHTEAIVFSVGGPYAFYDTKVPFHKKSPNMGNRDLLDEVIREAKKAEIRVIARLDFSITNEGVFKEKPEWFYRDPDGNTLGRNSANDERFLRTSLLHGYRDDDFAIPVLREVFSGYEVDGIHLNSPGFAGSSFDEKTIKKFNIPTDPMALRRWREERVAKQMLGYREIIHDSKPDALFMAEINSPESPGWGASRGFNHELLAGSYTNLLSTAGEPDDEELYRMRWWSALAADWNHASRSETSGLPVINLKVGNQKGKLSLKPVEEYKMWCYQAVAHNAGIKAPSYGLIGNMPDPRTATMMAEAFQFMERSEAHTTDADRIAPVALVWPAREISGIDQASIRNEMLGLYSALVSEHVLFEIILAHRLPEKISKNHNTILVPSASILNQEQTGSLKAFVESGGNLVLLDAIPEKSMPEGWGEFLGAKDIGMPYNCPYAVSAPDLPSSLSPAILVNYDVRQVTPPMDAEIWYFDSPASGEGNFVPEAFPVLEKGTRPILFSVKKGKGTITYFAGAMGTMIWNMDLPDYNEILAQMIHHPPEQQRILRTDAPATVNITAYKVGSKTVIHLVNATGKIPLDRPVPVGPVHIQLQNSFASEISWLAPGRETVEPASLSHQGYMDITIDKLNGYGILVLE